MRRRELLAAALGGVAVAAGLSGCRDDAAGTTSLTAATLLAGDPFFIAHRGGGGDWPEMTPYAYSQAATLPGLRAMEISVCRSADGVLVCSHDATTTRLTSKPYVIADQPWSVLSQLEVSTAGTVDPSQPAQPLGRIEDVAGRYLDDFVLFAEPKVAAATQPLLDYLARLGQPSRVVWKQYVNSGDFVRAKQAGFTTWGYVLDQPSHLGDNLLRLAASDTVDALGVTIEQSDAFIGAVVAAASRNGKPTIAYPIVTREQQDRARRLGCRGLMASRIRELLD